jgi:hypothetical protein
VKFKFYYNDTELVYRLKGRMFVISRQIRVQKSSKSLPAVLNIFTRNELVADKPCIRFLMSLKMIEAINKILKLERRNNRHS